jgi:hypothetical protein
MKLEAAPLCTFERRRRCDASARLFFPLASSLPAARSERLSSKSTSLCFAAPGYMRRWLLIVAATWTSLVHGQTQSSNFGINKDLVSVVVTYATDSSIPVTCGTISALPTAVEGSTRLGQGGFVLAEVIDTLYDGGLSLDQAYAMKPLWIEVDVSLGTRINCRLLVFHLIDTDPSAISQLAGGWHKTWHSGRLLFSSQIWLSSQVTWAWIFGDNKNGNWALQTFFLGSLDTSCSYYAQASVLTSLAAEKLMWGQVGIGHEHCAAARTPHSHTARLHGTNDVSFFHCDHHLDSATTTTTTSGRSGRANPKRHDNDHEAKRAGQHGSVRCFASYLRS